MKFLGLVCFLFFHFNTTAGATDFELYASQYEQSQESVQHPDYLFCKEILNIYGDKKLKNKTLDLIRVEYYQIQQQPNNDQFVLDYNQDATEAAGDGKTHTDYYTFKREDMDALTKADVQKIRGYHTNGFHDKSGHHAVSLTVVECQVMIKPIEFPK